MTHSMASVHPRLRKSAKLTPQAEHFMTMVRPADESAAERELRLIRQGLYSVPPTSWLIEATLTDGSVRLRGGFWTRQAAQNVANDYRRLPEVESVCILRSDRVGVVSQPENALPLAAAPVGA